MNHLIAQMRTQRIAVTSIGLDGEDLDQVTQLPKPKIRVAPGFLIATAEDTLKQASAKYRVIEHTHMRSAIGNICLVEVTEGGTMLIAGPSSNIPMERVITRFKELCADKVLIDGAFSRFTQTTLADGVILSIGANVSPDINVVVQNACDLVDTLSLKHAHPDFHDLEMWDEVIAINAQGERHALGYASVVGKQGEVFDAIPKDCRTLYLPRAASSDFLHIYLNERKWQHFNLILKHPTSLQGDRRTMKHIRHLKDWIQVLHPMNLIAVCLNPYAPRGYRFDRELFRELVAKRIDYPVFDVMEEGGTDE
ncbi:MAG: hypothetical protein PHO96_04330 [Candidatus Izemoplasmatales bacterium]|nr:hypothetical protein [Candidatus Izemoplasmatales bacterium]